MGTIEQRLSADSRYPYGRIAKNPSGGCYAILKLGTTWAKSGRRIFCSGRRISEDNAFCGRHDHLNFIFGDEDYLLRAFKRAGERGLLFPNASPGLVATSIAADLRPAEGEASAEGNDAGLGDA